MSLKTLSDLLSRNGERSDSPQILGTETIIAQLEHELDLVSKAAELWKPNAGPQSLAYYCTADELFYGGGAGGGKTDLVLGLSVTQHRASVIFRRNYSDFRGAEGLMERSRQIIGNYGRLNEQQFTWRGMPGGRSLEFGAVQHEKDKQKWKGRPHDLKAFDEIADFLREQYQFLIGWLRTKYEGQRCRIVCTGNPPTTEDGQWVIDYWAAWLDPKHPKPALPGELRFYLEIDGEETEFPDGTPIEHKGKTLHPKSRTFIPALVDDNPYYVKTGYKEQLSSLPEPLRSQLMNGDFKASRSDNPWQVIPTSWIKAAQDRWTPKKPDVPLSALGVDCARGGKDKFAIARRYGYWVAKVESWPGIEVPNGPAGAQLIHKYVDEGTSPIINLDIVGVGTSTYDFAVDNEENVFGLNGAERDPDARDKTGRLAFWNDRAKWWWGLRELLDPESGNDIELPPPSKNPQLMGDLASATWKLTPRGIQVLPKPTIKEKLGRSPDEGEAVVYAFANVQDEGGFFMF